MKRGAVLCVAALLALSGCSGGTEGPALVAERGWMRAPIPGAAMTAAYLTIENRSAQPVVIDGVTSVQFADVTLHTTRMVDGRMQMRPIERLTVPPGGRVTLAPGGDHLMLGDPRVPIDGVDALDLTLSGGGAPLLTVTLPVSRTNPWEDAG